MKCLATIIIFLTFWTLTPAAWATEGCTTSGGDVTCPKERYQLLRDKSRVGQILCEALEVGTLDVDLPADLLAVCESASLTSRIWADAQTKQQHAEAARKAQRAANVREGRFSELRDRLDRLSGVQARNVRLKSQRNTWRIVAVSAGGIAALLGGWVALQNLR